MITRKSTTTYRRLGRFWCGTTVTHIFADHLKRVDPVVIRVFGIGRLSIIWEDNS